MLKVIQPLEGNETLTVIDRTVLDFWRWAYSDLLNNTTRGVLAEYIVAVALGAADGVRDCWAAHDITTPDGIKVEVKSAAYVQSWAQRRPSRITFSVRPAKPWDPETGAYGNHAMRSAQVYVFALLAHGDRTTVDALDLSQWVFYVLPSPALDGLPHAKKSVTLKDLQTLGAATASPQTLRAVVQAATAAGG